MSSCVKQVQSIVAGWDVRSQQVIQLPTRAGAFASQHVDVQAEGARTCLTLSGWRQTAVAGQGQARAGVEGDNIDFDYVCSAALLSMQLVCSCAQRSVHLLLGVTTSRCVGDLVHSQVAEELNDCGHLLGPPVTRHQVALAPVIQPAGAGAGGPVVSSSARLQTTPTTGTLVPIDAVL